jgi:hypothetical protein
LGMPEPMIKLLVNLDAGRGNGPWDDPEEAQSCAGATTKVFTAQRMSTAPARHGRGVRQGSVGGPIKWIAFMNMWITWVKRNMKNEGYEMSASKQTKIDNKHSRVEVISQMFIDDSIWFTNNTTSMQKMVRMHEQFCAFHQIYLNKAKCDYIVVNGKAGDQVTWKNGESKVYTSAHKGGMDEHVPERRVLTSGRVLARTGEVGKAKKGDGRVVKYLGVWFEAAKGWEKQQKETDEKVKAFTHKLKGAKVSLGLAIYGINTKVIPLSHNIPTTSGTSE